MTSLPKTKGTFEPLQNQTNYTSSQKVSIETCTFLLNLSYCVKSYGHLCQISACFTLSTHQIWSCHVTQVANFKNV